MVLVLDAEGRASLAAVRALGRAGRPVCVAESREHWPAAGFASRWPSARRLLPDHAEPAAFVEHVLRLVDEHPIGVVLPAADNSVAVLTPHRAALAEHGAVLALASDEALAATADKGRTLEAAAALGIPVPRGVMITRSAEIDDAARHIGFPAVVKPARSWADGSGRQGRAVCALALDRPSLRAAVERMLELGAGPIVQQWLPGRREAIHIFYARGTVWAKVAVTASRTAPPLGGNSVLRETIPIPEDAGDHAERLVRSLGHEGYAEVEFRRDAHGVPVLMEVNPRLSASVETAMLAGADFPNLIYDWALGLPLEQVEDYRVGVRLRWLGGDLRWLRDTIRSQGQPDIEPVQHALALFVSDFLRPAGYDWFAADDPAPVLGSVASLAMKGARRVGKAVRRAR